jgi:hypothetical protein
MGPSANPPRQRPRTGKRTSVYHNVLTYPSSIDSGTAETSAFEEVTSSAVPVVFCHVGDEIQVILFGGKEQNLIRAGGISKRRRRGNEQE